MRKDLVKDIFLSETLSDEEKLNLLTAKHVRRLPVTDAERKERNRIASKKYYQKHREAVLLKVKTRYAQRKIIVADDIETET